MSHKITLSFTSEEYDDILQKCEKYQITIQEYIKFLLGCPEKVSIKYVMSKAKRKYNVGELFTVKDVLDSDWNELTFNQHMSISRRCYKWVEDHQINDDYDFVISNVNGVKKIMRKF